jgi:hypothetical protein
MEGRIKASRTKRINECEVRGLERSITEEYEKGEPMEMEIPPPPTKQEKKKKKT